MAVQIVGGSGSIMGVGAEAAKGAHAILKPDDYATLGHYRVTVTTGTLAAALAANAVVFSFRWGSTTRFCAIKRVKTKFMPLTPFTAATLTDHTSFDLFAATGFTASHTGGTGLTLTGRNQKMRALTMGSSLATDIRISTTAALGGGTLTLDTHPLDASLRKGNRVNPAAATEETIIDPGNNIDMVLDQGLGEHPLLLSQDEGFVIRNRTVWPAAGTGILQVTVSWSELTVY